MAYNSCIEKGCFRTSAWYPSDVSLKRVQMYRPQGKYHATKDPQLAKLDIPRKLSASQKASSDRDNSTQINPNRMSSVAPNASVIYLSPPLVLSILALAGHDRKRGKKKESISSQPSSSSSNGVVTDEGGAGARAGAGGAGAGARINCRGVKRKSRKERKLDPCNLVNKSYYKVKRALHERIFNELKISPEIKEILESVERRIRSDATIPSNIKYSKSYVLSRFMKEITPIKSLRDKHFKEGIFGIGTFEQVQKAYQDYRCLKNKTFLQAVKKIQVNHPTIAPGLNDVESIQSWFDNKDNKETLATIERLELNSCDLQMIPREFFEYFPHVKDIQLKKNDIETIPEGIFDGLKHLEKLCLDYNWIRKIPVGVFKNLKKLLVLNLSKNLFRRLLPGTFEGLHKLTSLQMYGSAFRSLPPGIFADLTNLTFLNLNNSRFHPHSLSEETFTGLSSLEDLLFMGSSFFGKLPRGVFSGFHSSVVKLDATSYFAYLPLAAFAFFKNSEVSFSAKPISYEYFKEQVTEVVIFAREYFSSDISLERMIQSIEYRYANLVAETHDELFDDNWFTKNLNKDPMELLKCFQTIFGNLSLEIRVMQQI